MTQTKAAGGVIGVLDLQYLRAIASENYADFTNDPKALEACQRIEKAGFCRIAWDGPECWRTYQSAAQVEATMQALSRSGAST